jgi:hypothetical protein
VLSKYAGDTKPLYAFMMFLQAQQEFEIRYYLWALSEFEKEIDESLSTLRTFKAGSFWRLRQFMSQLDQDEQLILARGLVKKVHEKAVRALGEYTSAEEKSLRSKYYAFWRIWELHQFMQHLDSGYELDDRVINMHDHEIAQILGENWMSKKQHLRSRLDDIFQSIPPAFETEVAARKKKGGKVSFVSKRKLQKAMTKAFNDAFGGQCKCSVFNDKEDPISGFDMNCCGWIIYTKFWFGRRENLISYTHLIASPTKIANPNDLEIQAPTMLMANCISFGGWLGITGQTQWTYLTDEDVEPACDAAIKLCGHFFKVAPKLLKGIEFEKIRP